MTPDLAARQTRHYHDSGLADHRLGAGLRPPSACKAEAPDDLAHLQDPGA